MSSAAPHTSPAQGPRLLLLHLLLHLLLLGREEEGGVRAVCPSVCSCTPGHREVDCSGKGLRRLPHGLQPNLRSLNLSHNRLHHLDGQLGGYAHLRVLDLSHNRLPHLPADLPRSLWQLRASSNRLRLLDKNDTAYQWNLRLLDLSDNRLERAVFINNTLLALRLLNLSQNHFWTVPTNMPSPLETVDLSHNSLVQVLPGSLDRLPRLGRLYLHGNRFMALPEGALDRLSSLRLLTLGENPWACHLPVNMSYLLLWMQYTPTRVLGCPCSGRFVCGRPPAAEGTAGAAGGNNGVGVWNHGPYDLPSLAANAQDLGFMGPGSSDPTGTWWHRSEPAPGGGRRERWEETVAAAGAAEEEERRRRQEVDLHLTSGESAGAPGAPGAATTQHRHTLLTDPELSWKWNGEASPPPGLGGDPRATLPDDGTLLAAGGGGVATGTKKTTTVRTRSVRRPNQSVPSSAAAAPSAPGGSWLRLWPVPPGLGVLVLHLLRVL